MDKRVGNVNRPHCMRLLPLLMLVVLVWHCSASFPPATWSVFFAIFLLVFSHQEWPQSSRVEILNDGGFRSDGRKQYELRDMSIDLSQQGTADGSAIITHGLTQVLVSVFGPREPKLRSQSLYDRAAISVEVGIAAFSSGERRKRSRGDK